jgi:hypothetical protein
VRHIRQFILEGTATIGGSVYVRPQDMTWEPTQFNAISIKVLYEDQEKGEMQAPRRWLSVGARAHSG